MRVPPRDGVTTAGGTFDGARTGAPPPGHHKRLAVRSLLVSKRSRRTRKVKSLIFFVSSVSLTYFRHDFHT